jgi:hypothetical protein
MSEKKPMTPSDAQRIQSNADRNGTNQDFKARAAAAAAKNEGAGKGASNGNTQK